MTLYTEYTSVYNHSMTQTIDRRNAAIEYDRLEQELVAMDQKLVDMNERWSYLDEFRTTPDEHEEWKQLGFDIQDLGVEIDRLTARYIQLEGQL